MDLDDIKRQALAARRFAVEVAPVTFTLQVPTKLETTVAFTAATNGGRLEGVALLQFQRALVLRAIVGWSGVRLAHVLQDYSEADLLPFDVGAVELLLDAQPVWEELITVALVNEISKRRQAWDTAAKN